MDCDWVLMKQDGTVLRVTLQENALPQLGDGKLHESVGYEVVAVGTKLVSRKNPFVLAAQRA